MKTWRIGLFGLGTVGRSLVGILSEMQATLVDRTDAKFEVVAIVDRSFEKKKETIGAVAAGADPALILGDPAIDIVVELLGGLDPARSIIESALQSGKHVVTANKALLARHGQSLFQLARSTGRHIGFEASVAGALPVIQSLRRGLIANEIRSLYGILNGTCNFIISRMQAQGMSYAAALKLAQERGFAEADPAFDVGGHDAAQKLALLSALAFDGIVSEDAIQTRGIVGLEQVDLRMAESYGFAIRLLGVARQTAGGLLLRVHPALIHKDHIMASVHEEKNAVFFEASNSGPLLIMGSGAGGRPTAAAVISDLVQIASAREGERWPLRTQPLPLAQESEYEFYLRFQAVDRPGVLAHISRILAEDSVSIASMHQPSGPEPVDVVLLTHRAREKAVQNAVTRIAELDVIRAVPVVLPIETEL